MSEQTKRIVMIGVIGLSVTLLLLGFIVGYVDKAKEKKAEDHTVEDSTANKNDGVRQYTPKEESEKEKGAQKDKSEIKGVISQGNIDKENPKKDYLKVPEGVTMNPKQSDMFPKKDLEETKAIANEFALRFHVFDKKKPTKYLDSVKGLLEQGYIDYLKNSEEEKIEGLKDVEGIVSRKVLSVEIREPVAPTLIAISWDAVVESEVVDSEGQTRKDSDIYSMMFERNEKGQFQVTDYYLNYDQKR